MILAAFISQNILSNGEAARAAGDTGNPNKITLINDTNENLTFVLWRGTGIGSDRQFKAKKNEEISYPRTQQMFERQIEPKGELTILNIKQSDREKISVNGYVVPIDFLSIDDKNCAITITKGWISGFSFATTCEDLNKATAIEREIEKFEKLKITSDEQAEAETIISIPLTRPYAVLGLSSSASEAEVRKKYRNLALKWHPDKFKNYDKLEDKKLAEEVFKHISNAYEILTDPQKAKRVYTE